MNDKDFAELVACFREAGQIKAESTEPGKVDKTEPPAVKPALTKLPVAQAQAGCSAAASKKLTPLKDVKKPLGL